MNIDFDKKTATSLSVIAKEQGIVKFHFNEAQEYIHKQLQQQLHDQKKVRLVILKGRQQGCTTYVAARYYWNITRQKGRRAFIVTHSGDASRHVMSITERFYDYDDDPMKPKTESASQKGMHFANIDSAITIATAGGRAIGRSHTIHYLHASEVAFWPNASHHMAGLVQAVPNVEGTQIILESTANGPTGKFYELWQESFKPDNPYKGIFVPWFWQKEYQATPPKDWRANQELIEYQQRFGLSDAQIYWAYQKQQELGDVSLFDQEYPATAEHAFAKPDSQTFIDLRKIDTKLTIEQSHYPIVMGVDPARFGDDTTAICIRQGRRVLHMYYYHHLDTMQITGWCVHWIKYYQSNHCFVDVVGIGAGVVDRLRELGYGACVHAVNAAHRAPDNHRYKNLRAHMWDSMRTWLYEASCCLAGDQRLEHELCSLRYHYDSSGRLCLESKQSLKSRGICSPDGADALALTFAYPVNHKVTRLGAQRQAGHDYAVI